MVAGRGLGIHGSGLHIPIAGVGVSGRRDMVVASDLMEQWKVRQSPIGLVLGRTGVLYVNRS